MADILAAPLPADLPTDWTPGQTVAPNGADAGLSQQHGYNYLMEQVNAAQRACNEMSEHVDGGEWDMDPVTEHDADETAHINLVVDGNNTDAADTSTTLEEHLSNPNAHQNLTIDGNAGK